MSDFVEEKAIVPKADAADGDEGGDDGDNGPVPVSENQEILTTGHNIYYYLGRGINCNLYACGAT